MRTLRGGGVESGCNGGLLGNSGRRGGCNATQDAQDAQDAKTTSPTSERSDNASDAGSSFADVHFVGLCHPMILQEIPVRFQFQYVFVPQVGLLNSRWHIDPFQLLILALCWASLHLDLFFVLEFYPNGHQGLWFSSYLL